MITLLVKLLPVMLIAMGLISIDAAQGSTCTSSCSCGDHYKDDHYDSVQDIDLNKLIDARIERILNSSTEALIEAKINSTLDHVVFTVYAVVVCFSFFSHSHFRDP